MPHKRAPKTHQLSEPLRRSLSPTASASGSKKRLPSPTRSESLEISPPPPKKARKNAPGSVEYDALPPVSIGSSITPTRSTGKQHIFGSIKPESVSDAPIDSVHKMKRSRKPSAKAVYMVDTNIVSPTKKEKNVTSTSPPFDRLVSHKGKERKRDTPSHTSSEGEDCDDTPNPKPQNMTEKLARAIRRPHHDSEAVIIDSGSDSSPTFSLSRNKARVMKETQKDRKPISISSDDKSGAITHNKRTVTKKGPKRSGDALSSDEELEKVSRKKKKGRTSLKRNISSPEPVLATPPRKTVKSRSKKQDPSSSISKDLKSVSPNVTAKSPAWDIENAQPTKEEEMTGMPDDLEPLPPFELLPYSDKVKHCESYMLASEVLYASLEESIAKTFLAAVRFKRFDPFVNFSRVDLNAVGYKYNKGLSMTASPKNLAVSFLTGSVVSCNLIVPKVSTREGAANTKSISVVPILDEYERYISYIGLKFGSGAIHGPFFDSSYLMFSTRKDGYTGSTDAVQSEPGTPSIKNKFFVKRTAPVSSASWYSKPFPTYLSFGDHVPIYDLRGSSFSFQRDDFDRLRSLPQFEVDGVPKDLPGDSLVTVAHTVNSFVGDGRKVLSLNVQFVLFHGFLDISEVD